MKKKIKAFFLAMILFGIIVNYIWIWVFNVLTILREKGTVSFSVELLNILPVLSECFKNELFRISLLMVNAIVVLFATYLAFVDEAKGNIRRTGLMRITDDIYIPVPAGSGQYGSARFMDYKELDKTKELACFTYNPKKPKRPKKGGVVIGIRAIGELPKKGKVENIIYMNKDRHLLVVGATRSGKSRRLILESIWITLLAGENIVVTDPKGELWAYTHLFARALGYQEVVIDFREPNKGSHHNYMQEILNALKDDDTAEAIDLTWDLVSVLVGEAKGEPIWHNGECAAIAATILIVAMEAPEEYRNLTNVYYFLFNMAKPDEYEEMPITKYLDSLPETHPARAVFAMAEIAHTKTRGSFFSSALGTLKHFTNPKIAEMTAKTDYDFEAMAKNKTIVYIILPDEKTTLYGLGSMYIMQHYIYNVKAANNNGGRCPIDWWYFLDEFGNLPYIPPIPQFLAVGAGRGLRFFLALQDFQQLEKRYKDDYSTIKNNCDGWIYLKCSNKETLKEFSERCDNYTVQVNSTNYTDKDNRNSGDSHGASLTGRALLMPGEVGKIDAPFSLNCFSGKNPLMLISPDLSYYAANKELGLGDEEYNRKIIVERNGARPKRPISEIQLWGIWNEYKVVDDYSYDDEYGDYGSDEEDEEKISFLS